MHRLCFAAALCFAVLCFAVLCLAVLGGPSSSVAAAAASGLNSLRGPLSVIHVGELRDGGTLTLALADPQGLGDGVLFDYKHGSKTQGRLYADGHLVPLGSPAQVRVLAAIGRYLDAQFTPAQQINLASGTLTAAAHAYGDRGYYACRLLYAARRLQQIAIAKPKACFNNKPISVSDGNIGGFS